jgi:hypothetical protein
VRARGHAARLSQHRGAQLRQLGERWLRARRQDRGEEGRQREQRGGRARQHRREAGRLRAADRDVHEVQVRQPRVPPLQRHLQRLDGRHRRGWILEHERFVHDAAAPALGPARDFGLLALQPARLQAQQHQVLRQPPLPGQGAQ